MITSRDLAFLATGILLAMTGLVWMVLAVAVLLAVIVAGFLATRVDGLKTALGGRLGFSVPEVAPPQKRRQRPRAAREPHGLIEVK